MNRRKRTAKNRQWHRIRGRRISGVLFELDPYTATVRIKRGRAVEIVELGKFGVRPSIDTEPQIVYNEIVERDTPK